MSAINRYQEADRAVRECEEWIEKLKKPLEPGTRPPAIFVVAELGRQHSHLDPAGRTLDALQEALSAQTMAIAGIALDHLKAKRAEAAKYASDEARAVLEAAGEAP